MTRRIRSFRSWMAIAFLIMGSLALIAAPSVASAQTADPDDALPYPGPFGEEAPAEADASTEEVLGETVVAQESGDANDADHHDDDDYSSRSIDAQGHDMGSRFVRPNPIPSSDPAAAAAGGGTAGGLAVTGSDVEPIVGMAAGLLTLGGAAMVSSRRRLSDFS